MGVETLPFGTKRIVWFYLAWQNISQGQLALSDFPLSPVVRIAYY